MEQMKLNNEDLIRYAETQQFIDRLILIANDRRLNAAMKNDVTNFFEYINIDTTCNKLYKIKELFNKVLKRLQDKE